jgi:hypothetical protein
MSKTKTKNVLKKSIKSMTTSQLREKHLEVFGKETTTHNKQFLVKKLLEELTN